MPKTEKATTAPTAPSKRRRGVPDVKPIAQEDWDHFLNLIANGCRKDLALKQIQVTDQTFQAWVTKEERAVEYRQAQLTWLRREWPLDLVEDVMVDIARGERVQAVCKKRGLAPEKFYTVILKDPYYREMHDEARKIAMEAMADELLEISDEIDLNGATTTANSAIVNQARLKVQTRQWLMSRLYYQKFGDRMQQDIKQEVVVNHAEQLEEARKRKEEAARRRNEMRKGGKQEQPEATVH